MYRSQTVLVRSSSPAKAQITIPPSCAACSVCGASVLSPAEGVSVPDVSADVCPLLFGSSPEDDG